MSALGTLVERWLPNQRWYGGKGQATVTVQLSVLADIAGEDGLQLLLTVAEVRNPDGRTEYYSVPLAVRAEADPDVAHALLDRDTPTVSDALHDAAASELLLAFLATGGTNGPVSATSVEELLPQRGRPIGAEQSNTSVIYGDTHILKVFRRLVAGVNPDLEVARALWQQGGRHVAPPLGWLETTAPFPATLGILQPFFVSASEGWALATTSVRDLLADPHISAADAGGDFAGEAERLGVVTAELHADLARALPTGTQNAALVVAELRTRLDEAARDVPELAGLMPAIAAAYDQLSGIRGQLAAQRVHGDYHLGQVLRVDTGWVVLDFEGEPARPLADRTQLMSPLRDVAGMLRSFDYAAQHLLADHGPDELLTARAVEWAERNRTAFLDGYLKASDVDVVTMRDLLRAFELDKAVYEVRYEARHRPTWLPIPLAGITRLVEV